jgi:hypothetical protein
LDTPNFTVAQLAALVVAGVPILAQILLAFGVYAISDDEQKALSDAVQWGGLVAVGLFGGDAVIRHGRARALAPPNVIHVNDPREGVSGQIAPGEPQGGPDV